MNVARDIISKLAKNGQKLCAAESCTGGLIADMFVSESGASEVFLGSLVCYDEKIKRDVLGVNSEIIEKFGVVSAECAESMAKNALRLFGADFALSATGYAQNSDRADVEDGTIFIACASKTNLEVRKIIAKNSRNENRKLAANIALELLANILKSQNF